MEFSLFFLKQEEKKSLGDNFVVCAGEGKFPEENWENGRIWFNLILMKVSTKKNERCDGQKEIWKWKSIYEKNSYRIEDKLYARRINIFILEE